MKDQDRAVIEFMMSHGMDRSEATLVAELSRHASDEAQAAAYRVAQTAPPHLVNMIYANGLLLLAQVTRKVLSESGVALVEMKKEG